MKVGAYMVTGTHDIVDLRFAHALFPALQTDLPASLIVGAVPIDDLEPCARSAMVIRLGIRKALFRRCVERTRHSRLLVSLVHIRMAACTYVRIDIAVG